MLTKIHNIQNALINFRFCHKNLKTEMVHLISHSKIVLFCWDKWRQIGSRHKGQVNMRGWDKFKYYTLEDKKSTLLGQSSTILKTNKIQENSDRNALKCSGTHWPMQWCQTVYIKRMKWQTSVENTVSGSSGFVAPSGTLKESLVWGGKTWWLCKLVAQVEMTEVFGAE